MRTRRHLIGGDELAYLAGSIALDKTVVVLVERRLMHPLYKKFIKRTKRYQAHDQDNRAKTGDLVRIGE